MQFVYIYLYIYIYNMNAIEEKIDIFLNKMCERKLTDLNLNCNSIYYYYYVII